MPKRHLNTGPKYPRLTTHQLIAASQSAGVNMDTVMDTLGQVIFFRCDSSPRFLVAVEDRVLPSIVSISSNADELRRRSERFDRIVIAEIEQNPDSPQSYKAIIEIDDKQLIKNVTVAAHRFWTLLDSFRAWNTFADYLKADNNYNVETTEPLKQIPLDYQWLTGEVCESVFQIPHYEHGTGVFIDPETGLVPVCTSSIYADILAQEYRIKYGLELAPQIMPCLGCYLSGLHQEATLAGLRGALLNGQWPITCFDCGDRLHGGGHHFLHDVDGHSYRIYGCKDQKFRPIWFEKSWDSTGVVFSMPCKPVAWHGK